MARKLGGKLVWGLLGVVLALLFVRMFFVGLYYVDSDSMEPTVHGSAEDGEYLAVRYGSGRELERFDLVALLPENGQSKSRVKRTCGLTGEEIMLRGGDLLVDGELLPPEAPRPPMVLIFDDARLDVQSWFRFTENWSLVDGELKLDASEVERGSGKGLLYMRQVLKDHYFDVRGELVLGKQVVGDAEVLFEVRLEDDGTNLRLGLSEQGDVFEVWLARSGDRARLSLLRRNSSGESTMAAAEIAWESGFHQLRLRNRDNHLRFAVDGEVVASASYDSNVFMPTDSGRRGLSAPTDRVFFGGEGGRATFRRVRVLRDLHYTARGKLAAGQAVLLGPAEILVLGDNSSASRDGRDWGPTDLSEVLGRPLGVVWPPSAARRLPEF